MALLGDKLRNWISRPKIRNEKRIRLPWWGICLHSNDKNALTELVSSSQRLQELMKHPGWKDVESVIYDWLERYTEQARRLGQQMQESEGRLVLREDDTPADDRRRLIACAQASALQGLLSEIRQRSQVESILNKRDFKERVLQESGELV